MLNLKRFFSLSLLLVGGQIHSMNIEENNTDTQKEGGFVDKKSQKAS